jgi:CRP/FNR family transcriptional regulator, cyclic AMP receptor protein
MDPFDSISPWLKVDLETWSVFCLPQYLVQVPAGTAIFGQGEAADCVYVVESGRVMLRAANREGREQILMFAEKGGLFGELGLFVSAPQPCSAVAIVDCRLYRIPSGLFLEKAQADPAINRAVMTLLARKVNLHMSQVLGLSFGDVRYRVAGVLLYVASMYGTQTADGLLIDLPFTHQDMADLVKSSRVTVSHVLHAFRQSGILVKRKGRYHILDLSQLKEIVRKM